VNALKRLSKRKALSQMIFKNRSLVCGFFMFASLTLIGCGEHRSIESPNAASNAISGVYIGMSEADVLKLLGEPDYRNSQTIGADSIIYSGLTVSLMASDVHLESPKVVWGVWARSPEHCLGRRICPNDSLKSVKAVLGEPMRLKSGGRHYSKHLVYMVPELEACWIEVSSKDDVSASDVRLICQP